MENIFRYSSSQLQIVNITRVIVLKFSAQSLNRNLEPLFKFCPLYKGCPLFRGSKCIQCQFMKLFIWDY